MLAPRGEDVVYKVTFGGGGRKSNKIWIATKSKKMPGGRRKTGERRERRETPERGGVGSLKLTQPEGQHGSHNALGHSTSCPGGHGGGFMYVFSYLFI